MLWPRAAALRAESIRGMNPFAAEMGGDRLFLERLVVTRPRRIRVDAENWIEASSEELARIGIVELFVPRGGSALLAEAMIVMAAYPIDAVGLLLYARLVGVRQDEHSLYACFELPEALQ